MASLVMGVVGGIIGWVGSGGNPMGAYYGFMIGAALGGALFPGSLPDQTGPRLADLKVQNSAYGMMMNVVYGTIRVAGNVIWSDDIVERRVETTQGGKGGPSQTTTTFNYTCSFAISICEGPIKGVRKIWADGTLIYDISAAVAAEDSTGLLAAFTAVRGISSYKGLQITVYEGNETQTADPTIEAVLGAGNVPAYRGQAYIVFTDFLLGKWGNRMPNFHFEVVSVGSNQDATPPFTFGETNTASVDFTTGYVWTNPLGGTAYTSGSDILFGGTPAYQIQVYDPITTNIVKFWNTPSVTEYQTFPPYAGFRTAYPSAGTLVCSGGWVFVGAGAPGFQCDCDFPQQSPIGLAYPTSSSVLKVLMSSLNISGTFNNAFYWPATPVPCTNNNAVYFAGGNGLSGGLAVGFSPEGVVQNSSGITYDVPDRSGDLPRWSSTSSFASRKNPLSPAWHYEDDCSYPGSGVTTVTFPDWAFKVTTVEAPSIAYVQGWGGYISKTDYHHINLGDSLNLDAMNLHDFALPVSSGVDVPPIVYDPINDLVWAFCSASSVGHCDLYKVYEFGAVDEAYTLAVDTVYGGIWDTTYNCLRLLVSVAHSPVNQQYIMLFDPSTQEVLGNTLLDVDLTAYPTGIHGPLPTAGQIYNYPGQGFMIYNQGTAVWKIQYGDILFTKPVPLSEVVANLSQRAGLTPDDYDVSQLTDLVDGYAIARQTNIRAAISELQQAYFFDAVESDNVIKFVKRGAPHCVVIPTEDLAAHNEGDSLPDLLTTVRQQEVELPNTLNVVYLNIDAYYQNGTQQSRRLVGSSGEAASIEIPVVLSDSKAKQIADVLLFGLWTARTMHKFQTSNKYAKYEPTDVIKIDNKLLRIIKKDEAAGLIKWEAVAEQSEVYVQPTTGVAGTTPVQTIPIILATVARFLDIPLLRDVDDSMGFYYAATSPRDDWSGTVVYKSPDEGVSYEAIFEDTNMAVAGQTLTTLMPFDGGNIFDELNYVDIEVINGELASVSELAVLNSSNAAMIGNEIIQFKNAELLSENVYRLSGFLRGRRGTEWCIPNHGVGEKFVLLTPISLRRVPSISSEINQMVYYKSVTIGNNLSDTNSQIFRNSAVCLRPYSPVQLGGGRNAAGDLTITWIRRSRTYGDWHDLTDVPVGEESELYDVEIFNDSTYETVIYTITGLTSQTAEYSAALQTSQFASPQATVYIQVYQVSATVGRGTALQGSV